MSDESMVVLGAGLAGAKAAEALRDQGHDGPITIIGDEPHLPYERPPLSKGYLQGSQEREKAFVHDHAWYAEHDVRLLTATTASVIDRDTRRVVLAQGEPVAYDRLLLATGARPRSLPLPGADAAGVHHLRTFDDADRLKERFGAIERLLVIGAGWIGLEVAAAARAAGVDVVVVEAAELPLLRALGAEVAQVFADVHRAHGVDLRLGASLVEIATAGGVATGVTLDGGEYLAAEAVLVGVGVQPNVELAQAAGLAVDNGVLVDASMCTTDPRVFAAGDVANAEHPFYGQRLRVEHWANALKQPKVAAASMLGQQAEYDDLPYFYTDQFDLGMEYVGYVEPGGYDAVVFRGDVASREFIAFWTKDGRVLAGMNVNVWDVTDDVKALIRSRTSIDAARLSDPAVALGDLL